MLVDFDPDSLIYEIDDSSRFWRFSSFLDQIHRLQGSILWIENLRFLRQVAIPYCSFSQAD